MNVDSTYEMNGSSSEEAIAEKLQGEATFGYKPTIPLESLWTGVGDTPLITLRRDIEFMQMHPVVSAGMDYYCSGIAGAEFWGGPEDPSSKQNIDPNADPNADPSLMAPTSDGKPISPDDRVASFVLAHCRAFWQRGLRHIQDGGYPYGWAAGEHIYDESDGMLVWSHLKDVHPYDAHILTLNYQPVGIKIKNLRGRQPIDLWFASKSIPAKACWYAHRPRFGQFHGRSQLVGAWRPWRRLGWRDAVEQVIDAAVYRAGYKGPVVKHPKEDLQTAQSGIPGTRVDGQGGNRRSARDVARQIVEWAKAGAGFTLSSENYPAAAGGGPKWAIEFPEHVMDVRPLIEAAHYLEDQILLGMGIPPELIRAGGVGSGYAGRSIPREAFLDGQQKIANAILQMFVDQVVRPLVLWNFGDIPFQIACKPLLQTQADSKMGGAGDGQNPNVNYNRSQAAKDAWHRRKVAKGLPEQPQRQQMSGPKPQQAPIQPNAPFSLIEPSGKVLEIVRHVLRRAS